MTTHTVTISARGQVTLPAQVRRTLGVGPRDRVMFEVDDAGEIRVVNAEFTLESAFASVPPLDRKMDLEEMSRLAKEDKAERTAADLVES